MEHKISPSTRKWLISLVNAMDEEIGLREENVTAKMGRLECNETA